MSRIVGSWALVLIFALTGCGLGAATPDERVCRGVPASMGGCDPDQPVFTEPDCDGLATEFGIHLDSRLTAIIDGPASVEGNGRSAQALNALILTVARLNEYLRDEDLVKECDAVSVLAVAEQEFSRALREHAGPLVTDPEVTGV